MTFKIQIKEWWDRRQAQLESIKSAHQEGAVVRFYNGSNEEAKLTEEQSKELLSDLTKLIQLVQKRGFPEFSENQSDIDYAIAVHEWQEDVCFDLEDEVDNAMGLAASTILTDILKLPFTLDEA